MSSAVVYLTSAGEQIFLNVIDDAQKPGYYKFPIDSRALARLQVEGAERLFRLCRGLYATREGAPPLVGE